MLLKHILYASSLTCSEYLPRFTQAYENAVEFTSRTLPVPRSWAMAACRSLSDTWGNSSTPLWIMKHLNPGIPARIMGRSSDCKGTSRHLTYLLQAQGMFRLSVLNVGNEKAVSASDHTVPIQYENIKHTKMVVNRLATRAYC